MRLKNVAKLDIQYLDGSVRLPHSSRPYTESDIAAWRAEHLQDWSASARLRTAAAQVYAVKKPEWFRSAERSARRFVRGLGLEGCRGAQVTLVDIHSTEQAASVFSYESDDISPDAETNYFNGTVVRLDRISALRDVSKLAVGSLLVHELTHAAEWLNPVIYLGNADKNGELLIRASRMGHTVITDSIPQGLFFAEGIAEFNAGLYVRKQQDRNSPLISIAGRPSIELPDHYFQNPARDFHVSGRDGYSIELLAWGVENKQITSSENFINTTYASYSPNPSERLRGFRGFATYVDSIRRGLYTDLRALSYGQEDWEQGYQMVHEAVIA